MDENTMNNDEMKPEGEATEETGAEATGTEEATEEATEGATEETPAAE